MVLWMSARVLIAGGGVASIEAALALRDLAGDRVSVEISSPRKDFAYRPFAVGDPYGAAEIPHYDLEDLAEALRSYVSGSKASPR